MKSSKLEEVINAGNCAGCGLCVSVMGRDHAAMQIDDDGFLRPHFSDRPTQDQDRLIQRACPGAGLDLQQSEAELDTIWGPLRSHWLACSTNEEMRFKASSGGALSAVLNFALETGLADYVLHNAADPENPIQNHLVESTDCAGVIAGSGSRYGPSAPLQDIDARLADGRKFVFVGKPCDVAALRMYARQDSRVDRNVVLMISFMCAGVPSIEGTKHVLRDLGVDEEDLTRFRYRGHGWPGFLTATRRDGTEATMSYDESWGRILTHYRQKRCKICPDGTGYFADISFGDGWDLDDAGSPIFEERSGKSLVFARSKLGEQIFRECVNAGHLIAESVERSALEKMQPFQAKRKRLILSRQIALTLLGRVHPKYKGLRLASAALAAGFIGNLRSFAGTALRAIQNRV